MLSRTTLLLFATLVLVSLAPTGTARAGRSGGAVRFMTFNVEDLRPQEVLDESERVKQAVQIIADTGVSAVLVNEIAWTEDQRHVAHLAKMLEDATGYGWRFVAAPSNTGVHSGIDLDHDGRVSSQPGLRAYANDCFGYGEFPGHYAMALFVRSDLRISWDHVRTFRETLWRDMPGNAIPEGDQENGLWYTPAALEVFRLSSKSHWDVPVIDEGGRVIHLLCSHPTPPVFDGPEDRNGRRNHDEIRFWLDYIDNAPWITDDAGVEGGLDADASFIVMGDLNADPVDGDTYQNPAKLLLDHARVNGDFAPESRIPGESGRHAPLDATDTSKFGLRIDYVQPSVDLEVLAGGVVRGDADVPDADPPLGAYVASDHFPVWVEIGSGMVQ